MADELKVILDLMPTLRRVEMSLEKMQQDINDLKQRNNISAKVIENKFLKLPEIREITKLSRTSIYDYVKEGKLPKPVKIGSRSSVWLQSEVLKWMEERK